MDNVEKFFLEKFRIVHLVPNLDLTVVSTELTHEKRNLIYFRNADLAHHLTIKDDCFIYQGTQILNNKIHGLIKDDASFACAYQYVDQKIFESATARLHDAFMERGNQTEEIIDTHNLYRTLYSRNGIQVSFDGMAFRDKFITTCQLFEEIKNLYASYSLEILLQESEKIVKAVLGW